MEKTRAFVHELNKESLFKHEPVESNTGQNIGTTNNAQQYFTVHLCTTFFSFSLLFCCITIRMHFKHIRKINIANNNFA
jgi:hypothetical protein